MKRAGRVDGNRRSVPKRRRAPAAFKPPVPTEFAVIRRAYAEFEKRAGQVKAPRGAKTELLTQAIDNALGEFTVAELERLCPGVSRDHIRRRLKEMKAAGLVRCLGLGPGAKWRKEGPNSKRGSKRGS